MYFAIYCCAFLQLFIYLHKKLCQNKGTEKHFVIKQQFIYNNLKQVVTSVSNTPFLKFLSLLEYFLECIFYNATWVSYCIFLTSSVVSYQQTFKFDWSLANRKSLLGLHLENRLDGYNKSMKFCRMRGEL